MSGDGVTLAEAGRRLGGHCWLELQVFEVAGAWVPSTPQAAVKVLFDRLSGHGAWRAAQWQERLPVLAGIDRPGLINAPDGGWARCLGQLAEMEHSVARLAGLSRVVLPRLAGRYRAHLAASTAVAEAPTRRSLRMALADVAADRDDSDDALHMVLSDRAALDAAAGAVVQLEAAFLA